VPPASQRAATIEGVLIRILGNAVLGAPGDARILGWKPSAMGPTCSQESCHVECGSYVNFVSVRCRGEEGAAVTYAMLVLIAFSPVCNRSRRA
jgi:hypothetical protein